MANIYGGLICRSKLGVTPHKKNQSVGKFAIHCFFLFLAGVIRLAFQRFCLLGLPPILGYTHIF